MMAADRASCYILRAMTMLIMLTLRSRGFGQVPFTRESVTMRRQRHRSPVANFESVCATTTRRDSTNHKLARSTNGRQLRCQRSTEYKARTMLGDCPLCKHVEASHLPILSINCDQHKRARHTDNHDLDSIPFDNPICAGHSSRSRPAMSTWQRTSGGRMSTLLSRRVLCGWI